MKVFVVYTEWNRGHDAEGSATCEGVGATREAAERIRDRSRAAYREMDLIGFGDDDAEDDSDWAFDIYVEEYEVEEMPSEVSSC